MRHGGLRIKGFERECVHVWLCWRFLGFVWESQFGAQTHGFVGSVDT